MPMNKLMCFEVIFNAQDHMQTRDLTFFYTRVQQIALVSTKPPSHLLNECINIKMQFRAESYNMLEK